MIELIKKIGEYVLEQYPGKTPLDAMLNKIEDDKIKSVLEINVTKNSISTLVRDYYKNVTNDALFYQAGRGFMGGGIRLDYYKDSKVNNACNFCEIPERKTEIKQIIEKHTAKYGNETFVLIKINGKTPRQLFSNKFLEKMYSTIYNEIKGNDNICHLCNKRGKVYNTAVYKYYTNDKNVYNNLNHKTKTGNAVCNNCLNKLILGQEYIKNNLKSYWINNEVMFLPHKFDKKTAQLYESCDIPGVEGKVKLMDILKENQEFVIEQVGKTNSVTDIVFFKDKKRYFNIYYTVRDVLPLRFAFISDMLSLYNLKLRTIFDYTSSVKIGTNGFETTPKEKIRLIDAVFSERKLDRKIFFKRVMKVYKYYYLKNTNKKFACIRSINRIYAFLCKCGCLQKECDVMETYKNYDELFQKNQVYFDSNEKKAWFILGKTYDYLIYMLKLQKTKDEQESEITKTSLEKNFFFARKFDFTDFIYFSNLFRDKALKYSINNVKFNNMLSEAKDYMAKRENILSQDEAKYIFFWGMDSYFKKNEKKEEA